MLITAVFINTRVHVHIHKPLIFLSVYEEPSLSAWEGLRITPVQWRRALYVLILSLALTDRSLISATDFSSKGDSANFTVNMFRSLTFPIVITFAYYFNLNSPLLHLKPVASCSVLVL